MANDDSYRQIRDYVCGLPAVADWPEMKVLFERAADKGDRNWQLPAVACIAVGGQPQQALAAMAAVACLQVSIIFVDDLLDADPRGEYHRIGAGGAANLALAFQAAGCEAIFSGNATLEARLSAIEALNEMAARTALGQQLDVLNTADEPGYWRVVEAKSGSYFGAALYIGALFGGARDDTARQIVNLGRLYGEIVQLYDDLKDCLSVPANPDWRQRRSPLPILYARNVVHPGRARFAALVERLAACSDENGALAEAQAILVRSSAVSYCIYQILDRYRRGRAILQSLPLLHPLGLEALLEEQLGPVRHLLGQVGWVDDELIKHLGPSQAEMPGSWVEPA